MIQFPQTQPIRFNVLDTLCNCNALPYRQLVNQNDVTQFQMEIDPCEDAIELVVNGQFIYSNLFHPWTVGGAWTIEDFTACYDPASPTTGSLSQDILSPNRYYKTEITVLEIDQSSAGSVEILYGLNSVGIITAPGTYTFYGFNDDTNQNFTVQARNGRSCIDNISVKEVDLNIRFVIRDEAGTIVHERYVPDFITQDPFAGVNVNKIDGEEFNLTGLWLTAFVNWADVGQPDGCYDFGILDNCENTNAQNRIPNGEFEWPSEQELIPGSPQATDQPWELLELAGASLTIEDGKGKYFAGGAGIASFKLGDFLTSGLTYSTELRISNMSGSPTVQLNYGGTLGTARTTTGTFNEDLIPVTKDLNISITGTGSVEIEFIRHTIPQANYFINHDGVDMKLGNHQCTVVINACNQSDSFEMGFDGTGFSPFIRLQAKVINAQYPFTRNLSRRSDGDFRVTYFDQVKTQILQIDYHPEYVMDFLSLLAGFDHWYVDRVEYVVAPGAEFIVENYTEDLDDTGTVRLEIAQKKRRIRNVACTEDLGGCVLPPNILLLENGSAVLQEDGSFILING